MGGLGNQLFIWSAAIAICATQDKSVKFLTNDLKSPSILDLIGDMPSRVQFHRMNRVEVLGRRIIGKVSTRAPYLTQFYSRAAGKYRLKEIGYDYELNSTKKLRFLEGYFQSHRYVDQLTSEYLNKYLDMELLSNSGMRAIEFIEEYDPICLHIRAGDYLQPENLYFGVLGPDYYKKAIQELRISGIENILIFTDDVSFVKNEFEEMFQTPDSFYFAEQLQLSTLDEFRLISHCRRIIIANSTFSWWGAYLARSQAKVIAPDKWFKVKSDPRDLIPPRWQTVQSTWI
jgi:hypothetical protein